MVLTNLRRRPVRSLLTMLGIAVGVAAVVAFTSFGEGIAGGFERLMTRSGADLQVAQKDAAMVLVSVIDESVGDEIAAMSGIDEVAGTVIGFVQLPESPYFVVVGEDPHSFSMAHYRLVEGRPLSGRRQIWLGATAARSLKKQVGQTFHLAEATYRVVGIYETGVGMEDSGAVMSLDDAQRAFDRRGQVSYFNIKLKDARRGDEIQQAIEQRWPDLAATRAGDTNVQSEMLDLYRSFGWFLGLFAVLVGGLGMMNTTLMSVFERTREIGMLRAIGWRRRRIIGLIVGESLTLALAGGVLGLGLGAGLVAAVQLLPAVASLLSGVVSVAMIVQALVIALLLGLVGSLYPAWRAASLTPIEAMRADAGSAVHPGRIGQFMARIAAGGTLRNMWRRPTRTLVTMAGIGLAVGLIVALLAMTAGFVVMFSQLTGGKEGDLLAEQARVSDMALSTIDERLAGRIAIQPGVRAVSRLIFGLVSTPRTPYFILFGLDPGEPYAGHVQIREGRAIARSHEVMLGRFAATGMEKRPGDTLRLGGSSFRVVGIYENGSALEDSGGMVVVKDAQQVFHKPRQVSLLVIHLDDPGHADELAAHLETLFPELLIAKPATFSNRIQDMATAYAVLNTLIGLTLVVGGIVMTNTMLMSVFERTQEIGVLRAVGWHRGRVIRMVVAEALAVSLLSSAVGLLIGVTLNAALTLEPTMGRMLMPAYTPQLFLQAALLAIALGALGGLYPAWRAARLRPLDALRYE